MKLYSTQLAKLHIDYYLYQMCIAIPSLSEMAADSPVACEFTLVYVAPIIVVCARAKICMHPAWGNYRRTVINYDRDYFQRL